MVDVTYVNLVVVLVGAAMLIYKRPQWAIAVTIGLAAAALAYTVMFDI